MFMSHLKRNACASMAMLGRFRFPCKEGSHGKLVQAGVVDIHQHMLKSTTKNVRRVDLVCLVDLVGRVQPNKPDKPNKQEEPASHSELPFSLTLRYSDTHRIGEVMITPDVLTEYVRRMMPDAAVTVLDRTGTMNHLKVVVISAAFAGKNLLDRHRLVYQALDVPMKDGRIHALEITAQTTDEA